MCPWCHIGKRHLRLALAQWPGGPVSVRYRAFFLNPDIPAEGYEFRPYMLVKGGGQIPRHLILRVLQQASNEIRG